jgi:hypothetical protein
MDARRVAQLSFAYNKLLPVQLESIGIDVHEAWSGLLSSGN